MDSLHHAARGYYNNGSRNLQALASNFFASLDTNGDGRVSWSEFVRFLQQSGYNRDPNFFNRLDRDGDGFLNFMEVLTFYYIIKTRACLCNNCGARQIGLYFTCVECFDRGSNTKCYADEQFRHRHNFFLDTHMLLMSRRGQVHGSTHIVNQLAVRAPSASPARNMNQLVIYSAPVLAPAPAPSPARVREDRDGHLLH